MAENIVNKILKSIYKFLFIMVLVFSSMFSAMVPNIINNVSALSIKDFFINLFGVSTTSQAVQNKLPEVYLGGIPLGFTLECNGVLVIAVGQVHTQEGVKNTIVDGNIVAGDIVTHINDISITSVDIIEQQMALQENNSSQVQLSVTDKNSQQKQVTVFPAKDLITNKYKLGLWVRDNSAGVGTLTYVQTDNQRFGALGHSVCDVDTGRRLPLLKGNVFKCNIIGVEQSKKGNAGELKGLFLRGGAQIGTVDKNLNCGVFGTADQSLVQLLDSKIPVATKDQVKTGRASIFCCINGSEKKEYSIEIIKTTRYNKDDNKSMIIRITDPELIEKTGGIVQGMSGSPIVQNGMLVGAVTHVFVSDPTKGYGIFAQTMMENGK